MKHWSLIAALALLVTTPVLAEPAKKLKAAPKAAASDADLPFAAAIEKMNQGLPVTPTGNPDRDFSATMLTHDKGAEDLAKVELTYGKDEELKKIAQSILDDRTKEIAALAKWRRTHQK